jgi:ribosome assembly protein YihI (activator of Der GTPase)
MTKEGNAREKKKKGLMYDRNEKANEEWKKQKNTGTECGNRNSVKKEMKKKHIEGREE